MKPSLPLEVLVTDLYLAHISLPSTGSMRKAVSYSLSEVGGCLPLHIEHHGHQE